MAGYQNPTLGFILWGFAGVLLLIPAAYWLIGIVRERNQATEQLKQVTQENETLRATEQRLRDHVREVELERDVLKSDNERLEEQLTVVQEVKTSLRKQ